MSLQQRQQQCERENACNILREQQRQEANRTDCIPLVGKYEKCCTISPIAPTPLVPGCPCEPTRPNPSRFCTKINNVCDRVELTAYGKRFACNTGKMVSANNDFLTLVFF